MKAGVVFSGGGARGIAHLGVLKSILEHDIEVEEISGTSAGSIVGALYGLNYSPEDILEMIIQTNFFRFIRPSFSVSGLLSMDKIADLLSEYIKEDNFDALQVPLTITTTDLTTGKTRYISEGELIRPIMCSSCVPVIFKPIQFQGSYYIDGGVLNNLPVEPIRDNNEFIIGSHCNPISENFSASNMKNLLERSMLIAINSNSIKSKELCDLVIEPKELENISGFDIKKAKKMFTDGYNAANRTLDEYLTLKKPA